MYSVRGIKKARKLTTRAHLEMEIMFLRHALSAYQNPRNWRESGDTREIKQGEIVIGVEPVYQWVGPGKGHDLLQMMSRPEPKKETEDAVHHTGSET
jgi:hypothetical protein